ncbi:TraB/GumN family protein [Hyunsoonleella flava]|uniref:TraB/GumN family protein n=1 Tax=Hyunsoonleella flava TaxID=2527939 RepID=A0A4Q9FAE1_9FLAO|nr:TraB/GumN family protein [Hyunsoonleella flava]TBM99376.1 TraB/GumN family protein [Hyunsoonleella flava]
MKKTLFLLLVSFVCSFSFSQEKSLLWEISGNGLEQPSYIYGTMHVSSKVAFRLDDVFYKALNKSECVALESDPTQWLKYMHEDFGFNYDFDSFLYGNDFYANLFRLSPLDPMQMRSVIRFDNYLINSYLYRKNSYVDDFEEETYLDMFIYQAGKKNNKPVFGLEDFRESRYLTTKASFNMNKRKPDDWFIKLMEKKNMFMFQEDVYRERNIELLDSIGAATNTNYYREHMLFKRNENMVNVLDTLMHKKVVFSGVGAAHLGGEKGMLNMLRNKGYTVKPLVSKQTKYAKAEKDKLEQKFTVPNMALQSTSDGFISIKSFDELREFSAEGIKYYVAPDMTNGAYLTINRLNTFEYLPNRNNTVDLAFIKNLLYEDVPGTIIEKEEFDAPYPGISILNKTKKGDYQKYHIYKTPLEIIVIKFGGKKDFVLLHEAEIFNSISFKPVGYTKTTFREPHGKYTFECPDNYITANLEHTGKKLVQAQSKNGAFYFFQESPQHDTEYIEEDAFEAKYIHTSFYKNLDIKNVNPEATNDIYKSYLSSIALDSTSTSKLWLKSLVKDGSYYLMGYYGSKKDEAISYFTSLKFDNANYNDFKKVTDTSLFFTVNSPVKAPLPFNQFYDNFNQKKPYNQTVKNTVYTTKANEQIAISRIKFHDLKMYQNADSLWNQMYKKTNFLKPRELPQTSEHKKLKPIAEKRYSKNGYNYYTHKFRDSLSTKEVLIKYIQKKGILYRLEALTDSINKPSTFLTEFFDSFTPMDTLLGKDIFEDKTDIFFKALKENDSIALTGYSELVFSKKHTSKLIDIIDDFKFPENKTQIKNYLIRQLIINDKSEIVTNFARQLYLKSYSQPSIQNIILNAFFQRRDKASYEFVLELMNTDLPLGSKTPSFSLYSQKADSLKTAKVLFPELLNFSVVEEYKTPVYGLLSRLLDSSTVKPKVYKTFKKQIINDAKIQIKRSLGNRQHYSYGIRNAFSLNNYVKLLFPYRDDKDVRLFYLRLLESKDWEALTTYYTLLKSKNEFISDQLKDKTLLNEAAQYILIPKLKRHKILDTSETSVVDLKTYAKSKLFANSYFKPSENTIELLEEKHFETDNNIPIRLFLYKRTDKRQNQDNEFLHVIAFEDTKDKMYKLKPYYTGLKRGISISGYKTEKDIIDDIILQIKHKTRKRIKINMY